MEVMPSDVEKVDFFKEKKVKNKEGQRMIESRWASKENFIESRAKIAERKVLMIKQKEEQVTKQKDSKRYLVSKKVKDRSGMGSKHDSSVQNTVVPSQQPIKHEEDNIQSSKSMHKKTRSSQQLNSIYFNRTNGFHVTRPKLKKNIPFNETLPSISTPNNSQASSASLFSSKEIKIVQLGIFSARKDSQSFLKRFRSVVEQQFTNGIDINNIFDINSLQYHLLQEIHKHPR